MLTKKPCSKCKRVKEAAEFVKDARYKSGLYPSCKECRKVVTEQYKQTSRAKIQQTAKVYYHRTKEQRSAKLKPRAVAAASNYRAKKFGVAGKLSTSDIVRLFAQFGNRCLACGKDKDLSIDHGTPLAVGG